MLIDEIFFFHTSFWGEAISGLPWISFSISYDSYLKIELMTCHRIKNTSSMKDLALASSASSGALNEGSILSLTIFKLETHIN